mgnify:CR=1 FL=1
MAATAEVRIDVDIDESERKLRAFQGGIDVLGGSVESVVGGLALFGVENEYIKNLEQGALGAIAFADGLKRTGDGVVALIENTNLMSKAQKAFNLIAKANPYVLLASAVVAAGSALFLFNQRQKEINEEAERTREEFRKTRDATREAAQADLEAADAKDRLLQIQETIQEKTDEEIETSIAASKARTDNAKAEVAAAKERLREAIAANKIVGAGFKSIGFVTKAQEDLKAAQDKLNETQATSNIELKVYNDELQRRIDLEQQLADDAKQKQIDEDKGLQTLQARTATTIETVDANRGLITSTTQLATVANETVIGLTGDQVDRITNITDLAEEELTNALAFTETTGNLISGLNEIFTRDDEKREKRAFEINKKAQLAQAILAGGLAVNKAFASQIIPGDPTSLPRAIGAAALTAVQVGAQVAGIARQQFQSPDPSALGEGLGGGGASEFVGFSDIDPSLLRREQDALASNGNGNGAPIKAFVVAGDVANGLQARNDLNSRRKFN